MIASLNGEVLEIGEDSLVVGLGGLGLRVFVPMPLLDRMRAGEAVFLHTQLVVRQDALVLDGFESQESRRFFHLLLGVDGVGPRSALAILSALSLDVIRRAIINEQPDVFNRVSGIGRKTGQKILLHLQGKIGGEGEYGTMMLTDVETEVISALTSLGYSIIEAQAAAQSVPRDTPQDVETRLRMALQYFSS